MEVHVLIIRSVVCPPVQVMTTSTLLLLKCVVLAEAVIREFARTRTTEPRTFSDSLVSMWPFDIIMDTLLNVNHSTTHPLSLPPPCAAHAAEDKPSSPQSPRRKSANTSLQLILTSRETRAHTISSIISEQDVTEPTTTRTLLLLKCVVDAVAPTLDCAQTKFRT